MTTKFIIASLSILAGTMTGVFFSKRLTHRYKYYSDLLRLIDALSSEVRFRKNTVKSVMTSFYENNPKSPIGAHIKNFIDADSPKNVTLSNITLKKNELKEVKDFFSSLGTLDSDTQLLELELFKADFGKHALEADEKRKRSAGMYIKLGFLAGLALGIVLL